MRKYSHELCDRAPRRGAVAHVSVKSLAAAVVAGLLVAGQAAAAERKVVDRIAAVIEGEIITLRELEAKAKPYMGQLDTIKDPKKREKRRHEILLQVLDIEISDRVVKEEIERNKDKLGVTDKDIDRLVQEAQRANNLTREQLESALYAQGTTWSEYRDLLRNQLERTKLLQYEVQDRVQVKDADAKRRCEERQNSGANDVQVCAYHILKKVPAGASAKDIDQLRAQMSRLQGELAGGADFAAYALKYSDDKGAPNGDLGCFGRGEMVDAFEATAFALKVGEVSPVVRTRFGFHIIKVYDRRAPPAGRCEDENVLNTFRNEIYQEEMDRQMKIWLNQLRKKAFVDVRI